MSAWREWWHLVRWDVVRARWWSAACAGTVTIGVLDVWRETASRSLFGPRLFIPLLWSLLAGLGTTTMIQADSPLVPDTFFRGKPVRAGMLPIVKLTASLLAFALPALLVMLLFYLAIDVPREAIGWSLASIAKAVTLIVVASSALAIVTRQVSGTIALLVGSYATAALLTSTLVSRSVPTMPLAVPLLLVAFAALVAQIYRRPMRPRTALAGMVLLIALTPLGLPRPSAPVEEVRPRRDTVIPSGGDSVLLSIDSISMSGRAVRMALHIDAQRAYHGYVVSHLEASASVNGRATPLRLLEIVPPNQPTSTARLSTVRFEANGVSSGGEGGNVDMSVPPGAASDGRRIDAVAVFVARDSSPSLDLASVAATVVAYRWQDSVTVPFRVGRVWSADGRRVKLDTTIGEVPRSWRLVLVQPYETQRLDSLSPFMSRYGRTVSGVLRGFTASVQRAPGGMWVPVHQGEASSAGAMFAVPGATRERRSSGLSLPNDLDVNGARLFLARRTFLARMRLTAAAPDRQTSGAAPGSRD
jgi:hypothetical protein